MGEIVSVIEYSARDPDPDDVIWREMPAEAINANLLLFDRYKYRIDNIIYRTRNKEFDYVYSRERIWSRISND